METPPKLQDEPLWTAKDVAAFLRISLSMVYKLRRPARLTSVPVGAHYRFRPEVVRAFARCEQSGRVIALR